jgi:hypothetical protein
MIILAATDVTRGLREIRDELRRRRNDLFPALATRDAPPLTEPTNFRLGRTDAVRGAGERQ